MADKQPATKEVECKLCRARGTAVLTRTNVPGTVPVYFWLCPNCDKKGR